MTIKISLSNLKMKDEMENRYIERELDEKISQYLKIPQIIAILGPRRSGKTTLLQHWQKQLPNSAYLNFEDQKTLDLFDQDIETFAKINLAKTKYLILDEFHYAKNGGKNLKYIFDFYPGKKIFISGSSTIDLTVKTIKFLVGRVVIFTLLPFSYEEFLNGKDKELFLIYRQLRKKIKLKEDLTISEALVKRFNSLLEEYLLFGGYPEIVLQEDVEIKKKLLDGIYSLYFLKEVRDILGLIDDYKLKSLVKALSLQIGNLCQYHELSQLSASTIPALKKYLNFLDKTFVAFFVKPFFTNKRTELVKNPKVYFYDLGLRNAVIDNFLSFDKRSDQGGILENFVAVSLKKNFQLNFWRTKSKAEVDFVLTHQENQLIPIEVKKKMEKPVLSPSFLSFVKKYRPKVGYIYNLDFISQRKIEQTTVSFLPIFLGGL